MRPEEQADLDDLYVPHVRKADVAAFVRGRLDTVHIDARGRLVLRLEMALSWLRAREQRVPRQWQGRPPAWEELVAAWADWFGKTPGVLPGILLADALEMYGWECPYTGLPMVPHIPGQGHTNWPLHATREHVVSHHELEDLRLSRELWFGDFLVASCTNDAYSRPKRAYRPLAIGPQRGLRWIADRYHAESLGRWMGERLDALGRACTQPRAEVPGRTLQLGSFVARAARIGEFVRDRYSQDLTWSDNGVPQPPTDLEELMDTFAREVRR